MDGLAFFDVTNFTTICDELTAIDADLQTIVQQYGYPPLWKRPASFETLLHIILEQQVSLASALAALNKLKEELVDITPVSFLALSHDTLKACYFSRQKIVYTQHLATEILEGRLNLQALALLDNKTVSETLKKIKGIGEWTATVYLMMVLQRCDLFPLGDVALITSVRETKKVAKEVTKEDIVIIADQWKPYRTIAAFILWHGYLSKRKRNYSMPIG